MTTEPAEEQTRPDHEIPRPRSIPGPRAIGPCGCAHPQPGHCGIATGIGHSCPCKCHVL